MEKLIRANMFVIPNKSVKFNELIEFEKRLYGISRTEKQLEYIFGKLPKNDLLIQIWVSEDPNSTDENRSDNWSDHGRYIPGWDKTIKEELEDARKEEDEQKITELLNKKKDTDWPRYLPLSIIGGMKENEKLNLIWKGINIELTAKQKDYRYSGLGNFEDAIQLVM